MSLFDQMIGALVSGVTSQIRKTGAVGGLLDSLLNSPAVAALPGWIDRTMAGTSFGGMEGFADALRAGGLSDALDSWIAEGPNTPVEADAIVSALGEDRIAELAAAFGLPAGLLPSLMARFLPMIVDRLSPDGTFELPERSAA
ncbi:YidB family protein [Xanthobacter aminoxidans]|uniref:YidB family protein n=1 Tax=Xanthobacter aminoxidans TaxID=186280 RepID=UPI002022CDEF|nr:YidB family protein [Xanthobacter aminoxidans]MCL8384897.1 YidB family protein [Xanthobacter aminoxidans]